MNPEYKIYNAFYVSKENRLYFNQLKELTKFSNSSLQNILKKLVGDNILSLEKTKSNTFYKIKNKRIFALRFAEFSINKFNSLNRGVRIPLLDFLEKVDDLVFTIILFGSASKRQERRGSDIDILLVTDKKYDLKEIKKKVDARSNFPLSIFQCNVNNLKEKKDHIIIQAINTGFPIKGEQDFYELILNES